MRIDQSKKFNSLFLMSFVLIIQVLVFASPGNIFAKEPPNRRKALKQSFLKGLVRGEQITSGNETYILLPELQSTKNSLKAGKAGGIDRNLRKGEQTPKMDIVESKGPFVIYRVKNNKLSSKKARIMKKENKSLPVVINQRTGKLGIISGKIMAKLENTEEADSISQDYNLQLGHGFDYLGINFFSINPGQDILSVVKNLNNDKRVETAEIVIIEDLNVPY